MIDASLALPASRTEFMLALEKRAASSHELVTQTSLLLVDLDHFKTFNDLYGYDAGDDLLTRVAEQLRVALRKREVFGRLGGDEFVVMIPDSNLEEASARAEEFRAGVKNLRFEDPDWAMTVTIGVATAPAQRAWEAQQLLELAGRRLIVGKKRLRQPRDRVWAGQLPSGWLSSDKRLEGLQAWPATNEQPDYL